MTLSHLMTATAALALMGGAALAQQPAAPTPGSVTGDWNGAHAPSDNKQYQEKVVIPLGSPPSESSIAATPPDTTVSSSAAASATTTAGDVSVTTTTVTNGPVADTPENRAKYGQPMSRAGKRTAPKGN